jgi:hypothetical protein
MPESAVGSAALNKLVLLVFLSLSFAGAGISTFYQLDWYRLLRRHRAIPSVFLDKYKRTVCYTKANIYNIYVFSSVNIEII